MLPFELIVFLVLLVVGYIFGTIIEKNHYKSIRLREEKYKYLPTIALKKPLKEDEIRKSKLVCGSVVISIDYFKKFLAGLINFFGGRISSYETLIDRARREAILRMKKSGSDASEIINVKIETASISKNAKGSIGSVEVLAYGTALYR